jgi:hypothetical protein
MTGNRWCSIVFAMLACVPLAGPALAQVQVTADLDPDRTPVGQSVRFTVTVIGADREIVPPQFPDLPGVTALNAGQSQRFSFVDGRSRAEYSWSWSVVPRREGDVEIPAIALQVDGRTYRTMPRTLVVTAATASPDPRTPSSSEESGTTAPDAFVSMSVDRDTVVIGEQVILTFGFYRASRTSMFESPE